MDSKLSEDSKTSFDTATTRFESVKSYSVKAINAFIDWDLFKHLNVALGLRIILIVYGCCHDRNSHIKYTDVDYRVITDGARHVLNGESPYDRHTYRYSPILAWLMTFNILVNDCFGKMLFSLFDILIAIFINWYIKRQLEGKHFAGTVAKYCSFLWIYNPLSIAISSRGSADSLSCFFILVSLYFMQSYKGKRNHDYAIAGIFLGIAIHLRLYPIIFSFPMYLSLGEYTITRRTPIMKGLYSLIPNKKQIILTASTIICLYALTAVMYSIYGYKFVYETYIYHLFRKDPRHNFSLFFYHSYLRMTDMSLDFLRLGSGVLNCALMFLVSLVYGTNPLTLPFAVFCQAALLVIYNTVVTSQYFIWYLSLLPLVVQDIKTDISGAFKLTGIWIGSQMFWLGSAYLLEFQNQEVYKTIYVASLFFFGSCVTVLYQLISCYTPGYSAGMIDDYKKCKDK